MAKGSKEKSYRSSLAYPAQRAVVGWCSPGESADEFRDSLDESKELDRERGWNRFQRPWRIRIRSSANISKARNTIVRQFLALPHKPPWLFMVDADMAWEPEAFEQLLLEAKPDRIVGGLCFAYMEGHQIVPTIYVLNDVGNLRPVTAEDPDWLLPDNTMLKVDGTGAAFLCCHRDALQAMADVVAGSGSQSENPWFREHEVVLPIPDAKPGEPEQMVLWTSEDLWFCRLATQAGVELFVHTGVKVRHKKQVFLTDELYRSDHKAMRWW